MTTSISFVPAFRPSEEYKDGGYKSSRKFLDVVVNGVSLWEQLGQQHDMVSVLCPDFAASNTLRAVDRLLLRAEADLPNDRRSLFICAECGDLGCGAVTVSVRSVGARVLWSDFGYEKSYYENDYEEQVLLYTDVGPFEFDSSQYEAALLDALRQLQPTSSR